MDRASLIQQIRSKSSFLCVGLDSDLEKIPEHLLSDADPVLAFNRQIIEATSQYCVAYKINTAFYESRGIEGWRTLEKTLALIPENIFTIADAKRGDIGNTAKHYARTFFETFAFDSITLSPYMGEDSISPFLEYTGKWVILLGLTSNKGANDFQLLKLESGRPLYQEVIERSARWGSAEQIMYVAGATRPEQIKEIREIVPDNFLLVPGVGAQGGDLRDTTVNGINGDIGLLINSSREIIFSSSAADFAQAASEKSLKMQQNMAALIQELS